jgi:hypothetical protein
MRRWAKSLSILLAVTLLVLLLAVAASAKPCPKLQLKAASSTCDVDASVRLTVTLKSGATPYEVRIYRKVGGGWQQATTATLVSPGKYAAYVAASKTGQMQLKAQSVNSSGTARSCSNIVTVKVTG